MILRVVIQMFVCTCVATLLAMGIGAGYLAATGKIDRGKLTLKGRFGVFYQGRVGLRFLNVMGETVGQVNRNVRVSPTEPLVLTGDSRLTRDVRVPDNALKAALVLLDDHERSLGELARGPVEWFPMPGTR